MKFLTVACAIAAVLMAIDGDWFAAALDAVAMALTGSAWVHESRLKKGAR